MPFRFRLQAVLHYRHSVEHQEELRLRAANQQVARVRRAVAQIGEQIDQVQLIRVRDLSAGVTCAELQFNNDIEFALQSRRQKMQKELLRLETLRDEQRHAFEHARQARQILETLQAQQCQTYKRELSRREQRQLDDLFLLRRATRTPHPGAKD